MSWLILKKNILGNYFYFQVDSVHQNESTSTPVFRKNQVFGPTLQLLVFLDAPKEITAVYVDSKLVIVFMVSE